MEFGVHLPLVSFAGEQRSLDICSRSRRLHEILVTRTSARTTISCPRVRGSMGRRRWPPCWRIWSSRFSRTQLLPDVRTAGRPFEITYTASSLTRRDDALRRPDVGSSV